MRGYDKGFFDMNLSQLKNAITFTKELLEANLVEEILQKLDSSFSLNLEFSINQDFGINLANSDEECYALFQELLDINFPNIMIKCVESKLRINSDSALILLVEYLKFLIIKSKFPSDCIPSYFVDKVWIEHCVLTKHFSDVCNQILRVDEDILHYSKTPKNIKEFEEKYARTFELYKEMFGCDPHSQIWRNWDTEFGEFDEHRVIVNLERLVNYYRFEKDFITNHSQNLGCSSESFEKLVDEYAIQNPTKIYEKESKMIKIMKYNKELRNDISKDISYLSHLWRKNCKFLYKSENNCIDRSFNNPSIYCVGGLKFSTLNNYNINHYLFYSETERFLLCLDDYADHSCESVHLYQCKVDSFLNLNLHLLSGMKSWKKFKEKHKVFL